MGIQALVPFIPLKAKPFFFPVSRKLVIEALVLTESWIKGYSLRFINSFSGYSNNVLLSGTLVSFSDKTINKKDGIFFHEIYR